MSCCDNQKIAHVGGKTSDMCSVRVPHLNLHQEGYVPSGLGLGGGDYLEFSVCLNCGKLAKFTPLSDEKIREALEG